MRLRSGDLPFGSVTAAVLLAALVLTPPACAGDPAVLTPAALWSPPCDDRWDDCLGLGSMSGVAYSSPAATPPAVTVDPYAGDLWNRSRLTGDWGGLRSTLEQEGGVTFDLFATQYYQGIVRGGLAREFEYGGRLDYLLNLDGQKAGLWEGLFVTMHAETRFGTDVNPIDGLFAPSNIAMSFPTPDEHVTSITGLKVTQALSENFAVYAGKINTLDEFPLRYGKTWNNNLPMLGGFQSTSLVFNPIVGRTVPYSAAGVGAAYLVDLEPVFAVSVLDPEERADKSLERLFDKGVTILADVQLRGDLFGGVGLLNVGGVYGNARYRSLDPAAYLKLLLLGELQAAIAGGGPTETGSWALYANGYQSLWVDPDDDRRHWGVFASCGLADGNPNPIRYTLAVGLGGRSTLPGRDLDTFGCGFYYLGLSNDFKRLTSFVSPQQDEYGGEIFYNIAVTPYCRLTPNVQAARPSTIANDAMVATGIRLQLMF